MMKLQLGIILKELRVMHNVSQYKLAKSIKVTEPFISNLEANRKDPSLETLLRYSRYFKIKLSKIFEIAENQTFRMEWDKKIGLDK